MDAMASHSDPRALGEFLKARRAQLDPRECGLPETDSARRVAGLRREEVARLAAISVDYYTRLEQGRVRASAPVTRHPRPRPAPRRGPAELPLRGRRADGRPAAP
jgi:hypothetical protein